MKARLAGAVMTALVAIAMLSVVGASSASASLACREIKGVGSSLQKVAQELWARDWTTAAGTDECTTAQVVRYKATSSGNGKLQWGDRGGRLKEFEAEEPLAAFIGTDNAANKEQMEKMSTAGGQGGAASGILTVPVAQSGISIMVTLPKGCNPETSTTPPEINSKKLGEEFEKGSIEFSLLMHDKVTGTCAAKPSVLVRSANSGTTTGVKHFFANSPETMSTEWLTLNSTLPKAEGTEWPSEITSSGHLNKCCEKGQTLVLEVRDTAGSIGYADLSDSSSSFLGAWMLHPVGGSEVWSGLAKIGVESGANYVSPEETGGASNCKSSVYREEVTKEVKPGVDWSTAEDETVNVKTAYPICTLTFDLTWHNYLTTVLEEAANYGSMVGANETGATVLSYLSWVVGSKGQSTLATNHYSELPKEIKRSAERGVSLSGILL